MKHECECVQTGACPHGVGRCHAGPTQHVLLLGSNASRLVSRFLCDVCTEHYLNDEHSCFNAWPAEEG